MRALECSGPWPSNPWGRSSPTLLGWPHLSSAAATNWSMMTWAPLKKSPNCASHRTSASGYSTEYPYSKPSAANSDSTESYSMNGA